MKTLLDKLTDEKAQKELRQFGLWGPVLSVISLLIFWWLAIPGLAFSVRALLLTWHKGNTDNQKLKYRILGLAGIILSLTSMIVYAATN